MSEQNLSEAYLLMQKASGFKVGDSVKVLRAAGYHELGWMNCWTGAMSNNIGKTLKITYDYGVAGLSLDGGLSYPFFVLEKVEPKFATVVLNSRLTADVSKDTIKVGCQTFDAKILYALEKALTVTHDVKYDFDFLIDSEAQAKAALAIMLALVPNSRIFSTGMTIDQWASTWYEKGKYLFVDREYSRYELGSGVHARHSKMIKTLDGLVDYLSGKKADNTVKLNDSYSALIKSDSITVGDYTFSTKVVAELVAAHKSLK